MRWNTTITPFLSCFNILFHPASAFFNRNLILQHTVCQGLVLFSPSAGNHWPHGWHWCQRKTWGYLPEWWWWKSKPSETNLLPHSAAPPGERDGEREQAMLKMKSILKWTKSGNEIKAAVLFRFLVNKGQIWQSFFPKCFRSSVNVQCLMTA